MPEVILLVRESIHVKLIKYCGQSQKKKIHTTNKISGFPDFQMPSGVLRYRTPKTRNVRVVEQLIFSNIINSLSLSYRQATLLD